MDWIHHYQLFLFDFDGILVNTEELHFKAYQQMCANRGFSLPWDMQTYIQHAMYTATGVKEGIYQQFPQLQHDEPDWSILYQEKKKAYLTLLHNEGPKLMQGVEVLLQALEKAQIPRCVVTHSAAEQIALIRAQLPILNSIPHWITREDYSQPKPASECYLQAINRFNPPNGRVIGFEDSPRGLKALLGTAAEGVLLSEYFKAADVDQLAQETGRSFAHFSSFSDILLEIVGDNRF